MPREAAFRCTVIAELHRQLQWTSDEARTRLIDAAHVLLRELEDDRVYPLSFVAYRLTSWRLDDDADIESLAGDALRSDLVTMIQRVSRRTPLDAEGLDGLLGSPEATAEALGVSVRTLVRLRPLGLEMRWARFSDGRLRLTCMPEDLEWFSRRYPDIASEPETPIVDAANIVALAAGEQSATTTEQIVREVMARTGETHDRVRGVLRRAAARGDLTLPVESRLDARAHRMLVRAERRGIPRAQVARRVGVAPTSVHRALLRCAAVRLRALDMLIPQPDEATGVEAFPEVGGVLPGPDASVSLTAADDPPELPIEQDVILVGLVRAFLHDAVVTLPAQPDSAAIDEIETGFRVHARMRWRVLIHLMPDLRTLVASWCRRDPSTLPGTLQRRVLRVVAQSVSDVLMRLEPGTSQRCVHRARAAVERALLAERIPRDDLAESRMTSPPRLKLHDIDPARDLLFDPRLLEVVVCLTDAEQRLVRARWGIGGGAPLTCAELAQMEGGTRSSVSRRVRSAQRSLLRCASSVEGA